MKKFIAFLILIEILVSCSSNKRVNFNYSWTKNNYSFDTLINQYSNNIENIWGINEVLITSSKDYIQYIDKYYTRSHINFNSGIITIETVKNTNVIRRLYNAIISTLLISDNPENINYYFNGNGIKIHYEPLLYGQILDHENEPIHSMKQINKFANYLVRHKLQKRHSGKNIIWSIIIKINKNYLDNRIHKYLPIINEMSNKYNVDQSLILAIIQIESSFNPYAESNSEALGLMQIVRDSAGLDVFRINKKWGKPTKYYLLNPKRNIEIGTAYLSMLQNNYFSSIYHPLSRRYIVIMAYNSGINSVLKLFGNDKNIAIDNINSMQPKEVYKILTNDHPSIEARKYLCKVNNVQNGYLYFL